MAHRKWKIAAVLLTIIAGGGMVMIAGNSPAAQQASAQRAAAQNAKSRDKALGTSMTGRILDEQGQPIATALVSVQLLKQGEIVSAKENQIQAWRVQTGADGAYTIRGIEASGKAMYLEVSARGFINSPRFHIGPREFERRRTSGKFNDIRLRPGELVTGRCLGRDGKPAKATLQSCSIAVGQSFSTHFWSGKTADDGRFELMVPKGHMTELLIYPAKWAIQRVLLREGTPQLGNIRLQPGTRVTGRVVSEQGQPLPGCVVAVYGTDAGSLKDVSFSVATAIKTNSDGRFELTPLPKGEYKIWLPRSFQWGGQGESLVTDQPQAVTLPRLHKLDGTKEVLDITIPTVPTVRLSGKVIGPDGKPRKGARVWVSGTVAREQTHTQLGDTQTDEDGKYIVNNIPKGFRKVCVMVFASSDKGILYPRPMKHVKATVPPNSEIVTLQERLDKHLDNLDFELYAIAPAKTETPEVRAVSALEEEYWQAQTDFYKTVQAAKTDQEKSKLYKEKQPSRLFAGRFLKLAEQNRAHPDAAIKALTWIVVNTNPVGNEDEELVKVHRRAMDRIVGDYARSDKIDTIIKTMPRCYSPQAETLLRTVLKESPHRTMQAQAAMALAKLLKNRAQWVEFLTKSKKQPAAKEITVPNVIAKLTPADASKMNKEAEQLFELVATKYPNVEYYSTDSGKVMLGAAAKSALFEIRFLTIGKVAPDIEGEDIDGRKFKLSDYRGKVVVLDFWGHW